MAPTTRGAAKAAAAAGPAASGASGSGAGPRTTASGVTKAGSKKGAKKVDSKKAASKKAVASAAGTKKTATKKATKKGRIPVIPESDDDSDEDQDRDLVGASNDEARRYPVQTSEDNAPGSPMASVAYIDECRFGKNKEEREDAWLTGVLQVYNDPRDKARLEYRASFFLTHNLGGPRRQDWVGLLDAWRVEKSTTAKPMASNRWVQHFLEPAFETFPQLSDAEDSDLDETKAAARTARLARREPQSAHWKELASCLRALYTKQGELKMPVKAFRDELTNNSLIFIQMLETEERFQGQGLMRPMLKMFRTLLQRLPEWLALDGDAMLLLVPAAPGGPAGDMWKNDEEVEKSLTQMYGKCDQYVRLALNAKVGGLRGRLVTVMGRRVAGDDAVVDEAGPAQTDDDIDNMDEDV